MTIYRDFMKKIILFYSLLHVGCFMQVSFASHKLIYDLRIEENDDKIETKQSENSVNPYDRIRALLKEIYDENWKLQYNPMQPYAFYKFCENNVRKINNVGNEIKSIFNLEIDKNNQKHVHVACPGQWDDVLMLICNNIKKIKGLIRIHNTTPNYEQKTLLRHSIDEYLNIVCFLLNHNIVVSEYPKKFATHIGHYITWIQDHESGMYVPDTQLSPILPLGTKVKNHQGELFIVK